MPKKNPNPSTANIYNNAVMSTYADHINTTCTYLQCHIIISDVESFFVGLQLLG